MAGTTTRLTLGRKGVALLTDRSADASSEATATAPPDVVVIGPAPHRRRRRLVDLARDARLRHALVFRELDR